VVLGRQVLEIGNQEIVARSAQNYHQHHDPEDLRLHCLLLRRARVLEVQPVSVQLVLVLLVLVEFGGRVDQGYRDGSQHQDQVACLPHAAGHLPRDEVQIVAEVAVFGVQVLRVEALRVDQSEQDVS